jgi:hypothetical protein
VTLVFGHFGWRSLAAEARRERSSLEALLSAAAGYFHCELRGLAGRAAGPAGGTPAPGPRLEDRVGAPRGCVARPRSGGSPSASAVGRLLEHAALYYLAAVDSGREATWTASGLA